MSLRTAVSEGLIFMPTSQVTVFVLVRILQRNRINSMSIYREIFILKNWFMIIVAQSLSCVWLFPASWAAACQAFLSSTFFQNLLKLKSIESMMLYNHLILAAFFSSAFNLSQHQDLSNKSKICRIWPVGWRHRRKLQFEIKGSLLEKFLLIWKGKLLFYLGLQLTGWGPPTLRRAICFTQSPLI